MIVGEENKLKEFYEHYDKIKNKGGSFDVIISFEDEFKKYGLDKHNHRYSHEDIFNNYRVKVLFIPKTPNDVEWYFRIAIGDTYAYLEKHPEIFARRVGLINVNKRRFKMKTFYDCCPVLDEYLEQQKNKK